MRNALDAYYSPLWYNEVLKKSLWLHQQRVLEPSCGDGVLVRGLQELGGSVTSNDIDSNVLADSHFDFLQMEGSYDWVITNPPFSQSDEFVIKAHSMAKVGVAMFLRHTWDEPSKSHADWLYLNPYSFKYTLPRFKFKKNSRDIWATDFTTISLYVWEFKAGTKETIVRRSKSLPKSTIEGYYDNPERITYGSSIAD
jgi:hypothetical protein